MGIVRSTGIVALATLASRILGFIRDMVFAKYFGATGATDAFFVAFRIPNLLRRLVGEGALTISFIPVYTDYKVLKGEDEAFELARKVLSVLAVTVTLLVIAGVIFSPQIVDLFAWGFPEGPDKSLAVELNRIMFPYLLFVSYVAFAMGLLNTHGYFFAPSFAPVMLNIGMIVGIVFFRNTFSEPMYGAAIGVIAGGLLQAALQLPYMVKTGFKMKFSFDLAHPGIKKIFSMMAPALFGIAVYQLNILMSTILASFLEPGSISYLYYSDRLTEIVLGVFIVSIGNVVLPEMSRMRASDDMESFKKLYTASLRSALFLALPATAGLMALGYPIVSVLFARGSFGHTEAMLTARALFYSSIGISAISILRITTPAFFALKDTRTPVITSAISFVLNIALGWVLMNTQLKHAGLALANSAAVTVQTLIIFYFLRRRIGELDIKGLVVSALKYITASLLVAAAVSFVSMRIDWVNGGLLYRIGALTGIVLLGGSVYAAACAVMRTEELLYIVRRFMRKR